MLMRMPGSASSLTDPVPLPPKSGTGLSTITTIATTPQHEGKHPTLKRCPDLLANVYKTGGHPTHLGAPAYGHRPKTDGDRAPNQGAPSQIIPHTLYLESPQAVHAIPIRTQWRARRSPPGDPHFSPEWSVRPCASPPPNPMNAHLVQSRA
jgi:hypothetical protein